MHELLRATLGVNGVAMSSLPEPLRIPRPGPEPSEEPPQEQTLDDWQNFFDGR